MKTIDMYRAYLASTDLVQLCEKVGTKLYSFYVSGGYISGSIPDEYVGSSYTFMGEDRLRELRENRERIIRELLELRPKSWVDRKDNKVTWYCDTSMGQLQLSIGEALCERVKVGEREVEKIDPDFYESAPKVKVIEEVYEWRCSDDILGAMPQKEVAA